MMQHYIKIAFRNIWKHRAQSIIGIFGLAFALACFVPALYWFRYETSFDSFYPDADRIYRIYSYDKQTNKPNDLVSGILERTLHEQYPVTQTSTVFFIEQIGCKTNDKPYVRLNTIYTDSAFFSVFSHTIVAGDVWQPLQFNNNIVLTETTAIRLFGDVEKAIGQQIKNISNDFDSPYTVTAVVKDPPRNTNLPFDAILSHEQIKLQKSYVDESGNSIWTLSLLQMYVKLPPHADLNRLTKQLSDYPLHSYGNTDIELEILPVSDVRHQLNTDVPFTMNYIRLFVISGFLLLFSALFNFLHLHLDLFRQRIREFRLRTINGASRTQLIQQMLIELLCAILLALLPACFFVIITYPTFSKLLNIDIEILQLISLLIICGFEMMLLILFIGFILFERLSRSANRSLSNAHRPIQSLLQRLAVTMQLAISVVFIVATLVVTKQMRFVSHKDLGFDRSGIVYLSGMNPFINEDMRVALIKELRSLPQIEEIVDAGFTPQHNVNPFNIVTNVKWPGKMQSQNSSFNFVNTKGQFAETFKVKMLEGNWLDEGGGGTIVLNEEAVRVMGLSEPIGTIIRITLKDDQEYRIVGVVKDFHTLSFRSRIPPTIFYASKYPTNNFYIRTVPGQEQDVVQKINTLLPKIDITFTEIHPVPLSELYDRLNFSEQVGLKIFSVLSIVCLLISLFGIFAVSTAATQRRRKEIAVRKVMGAEVVNIVRIFLCEYILQVMLAGIVALPLAYIIMSNWLQGYAYRTDISLWLLVGVILSICLLVLATVLDQVLRVANSNPAKVVKSE